MKYLVRFLVLFLVLCLTDSLALTISIDPINFGSFYASNNELYRIISSDGQRSGTAYPLGSNSVGSIGFVTISGVTLSTDTSNPAQSNANGFYSNCQISLPDLLGGVTNITNQSDGSSRMRHYVGFLSSNSASLDNNNVPIISSITPTLQATTSVIAIPLVARLNIGASQSPGVYSGNFNVQVNCM